MKLTSYILAACALFITHLYSGEDSFSSDNNEEPSSIHPDFQGKNLRKRILGKWHIKQDGNKSFFIYKNDTSCFFRAGNLTYNGKLDSKDASLVANFEKDGKHYVIIVSSVFDENNFTLIKDKIRIALAIQLNERERKMIFDRHFRREGVSN